MNILKPQKIFIDKLNVIEDIEVEIRKDEYLEKLEKSGLDVMYMPIAYSLKEFERCMDYDINLSAVEMIFRDLSLDLVQPETFELCKKLNLATFVNAETLGRKERFMISAGLDDNLSIESDFERGWGKLVDMGFEIIQTDWVAILNQYLNERLKSSRCF